jgi:ribosome-binding ATPase YchF (GTP1/OBG family)
MTTQPEREVIEEVRQKLNKVYLRLAYGKSDIETAKKEVDEILHQELQKAREEERKKNRIGQIKDVQDQVRKKKEHGKAMYEKGRRDARHDWLREEIVKLEGEKLGGLARPIFVGANAPERMRIHNQALQTIIDRYQSELDQPIS